MLLLLRPHILNRAALQVVSGIYEVLSVNADHIRDPSDWAILFALLECSGAGAKPPPIVNPEAPVEEVLETAPESEVAPSDADAGPAGEPCQSPVAEVGQSPRSEE
ncbi:UNVERIFIED_CONTAM: hypothetical protein GTU68_043782, partial [Idotea baltica]|nr:hypothetical protein [Idotea baltica]